MYNLKEIDLHTWSCLDSSEEHLPFYLSSLFYILYLSCTSNSLLLFLFFMVFCFQVVENATVVEKGCHSEVDSYSAFWDNNKLSQTELVRILAEHKVTDVFVCGVAYDVCVGRCYEDHKIIVQCKKQKLAF